MTHVPDPYPLTQPEDPTMPTAAIRDTFDALAPGGYAGQEAEQGCGNYYDGGDPIETRNFRAWADALPVGAHVLVVACGDGLEAELLAREGHHVDAFDIAANMVEATRRRLDAAGLTADLFVDDVLALANRYTLGPYDGIMYAQAVQFIPAHDPDFELREALLNLRLLLKDGGSLYVSATGYPELVHERVWRLDGEPVGSTTCYTRAAGHIASVCAGLRMDVEHVEDFDGGAYCNQYVRSRAV